MLFRIANCFAAAMLFCCLSSFGQSHPAGVESGDDTLEELELLCLTSSSAQERRCTGVRSCINLTLGNGAPSRNAEGHVDNAVLLLHGTGGNAHSLLMNPVFSDVLFVPGGVLDIQKYFIILPDDIGHGESSKPSDGLHMHFPAYDYDDMVHAANAADRSIR